MTLGKQGGSRQPPHTRFRSHALANLSRLHLLSTGERAVLSELTERADHLSLCWTGSASQLGQDAGLDRRMIADAVKKLDEVGLVSIIVPFRHWHDGTIRVDCYAELVWTNGNEPPVPIAPNPPMAIGQKTPIRIEHRIEQPIEQSVPTTLAPTSHFVEASNGATEEAVAGRQGETAESRGKRWLNGSARGALSAHEDAELVLVGEAVQPSCPDCGGWPCQCLF